MEKHVEHAGCPLHYDVAGSGPALLLIQGVGVAGSGWSPQVEAFAGRFTCISYDNRGLGRSVPRGAPVSVERMAEDARAILDAERIDAAHVVGHSLGGPVAIALALAARDRVRSLALLCTFTGSRTAAPPTPRMIWLGSRTRFGTRGMRRRGFLALVSAPGSIPRGQLDVQADRLAALFGHDLADQPPVAAEQLRALRRYDATERLDELDGIPTLLVNAAHDPIAPPAAGRALAAAIPGARYVEIADASHGLPITHAEQTNRLLEQHLAAAAPGRNRPGLDSRPGTRGQTDALR